jgi:tetratricopeptide (TPR) repeat protein
LVVFLAGFAFVSAVFAAAPASSEPSSLKRTSEDVSAILSIALGILLSAGTLFGTIMLRREWKRDALVIEPLDVPAALQAVGLSGSVVAQMLSDFLFDLQRRARVADDSSEITFIELTRLQVDLQLPGIAWSVRGAIRYFKHALGATEARVLGEIVAGAEDYGIRLRTASGQFCDVPVRFHDTNDVGAALESAAERVFLMVNPLQAASIHYSLESAAGGYVKTLAAVQAQLAMPPISAHQDAYVIAASAYRAMGQPNAMNVQLELARDAARRAPGDGRLGARYCNFVGSLHRDAGEFERAAECFRDALQGGRDNAAAMSNLGLVHLDQWALARAEECFLSLIRERPNSSRGYRGLGLLATKTRRFDDALRYFQRACDVAPLARWPRLNYLEALRTLGRYEEALVLAARWYNEYQTFPPFLRVWGEIFSHMGRIDDALDKYREAVERAPFDPWAWVALAETQRLGNKLVEAAASADKALELRPGMPFALRARAFILRDQGHDEAALAVLRRIAADAWQSPWSHAALVSELCRQYRVSEARRVLDELPQHCAHTTEVVKARAALLVQSDRLGEALEQYQAAIDRDPHDVTGRLRRAEIFATQGKFDEAQAEMDRARLVRTPSAEVYRTQARIFEGRKKWDEAFEQCTRAIDAAPYDFWGHLLMSRIWSGRKNFAQALASARLAVTLKPFNAYAVKRLAEVLQTPGETGEAESVEVEILLQNALRNGFNPVVALVLCEFYEKASRLPEAEDVARATVERYPEYATGYRYLAHIMWCDESRRHDALAVLARGASLSDVQVKVVYAIRLCDLGQYARAIGPARDAVSLRPDSRAARAVLERAHSADANLRQVREGVAV